MIFCVAGCYRGLALASKGDPDVHLACLLLEAVLHTWAACFDCRARQCIDQDPTAGQKPHGMILFGPVLYDAPWSPDTRSLSTRKSLLWHSLCWELMLGIYAAWQPC